MARRFSMRVVRGVRAKTDRHRGQKTMKVTLKGMEKKPMEPALLSDITAIVKMFNGKPPGYALSALACVQALLIGQCWLQEHHETCIEDVQNMIRGYVSPKGVPHEQNE
jgi:hypothetical protein